MGIVKRQGFYNSIMIYAGMAMGYVNTIFLIPRAFDIEQTGLYGIFLSISLTIAQLPTSSITSLIGRFFPYFRSKNKKHQGFVTLAGLAALVVFALFSLVFLLLRQPILEFYETGSPLLHRYFLLVIPMTFFILWFSIFEVLARAIYKTVFASFLREFLLKAAASAGLFTVLSGRMSFEQFLIYYVVVYGLICIILLGQLIRSGEFSFSWKMHFSREQRQEFLRYGFYAMLAGTPWVLIQKIDMNILSHYALPAVLGGYYIYSNMSAAIGIPRNAMNKVTYQIVSDAWERNDLAKIDEIYRKTSVVQLILGALLFVGIIVNRDNLFSLMQNDDYFPYFSLFYFLGLGQLVDITGGLNAYIIVVSPRYKMGTWLVFIACVLCVVLNFLIVPHYGGMGATFVYFLTMLIYNFSTWLFLKKQYSLQPFSIRHLYIIVFAGLAFLAGWYLPRMDSVWLDLPLRSLLTTLVFALPVLAFRVSEDVNEQFEQILARLGWKKR